MNFILKICTPILNFLENIGLMDFFNLGGYFTIPGVILYWLSNFFIDLSSGRDYKSDNIIIEGKFNGSGEFKGTAREEGYKTHYDKNMIGRIMGAIGVGMMVWGMVWLGLSLISCLSCFTDHDLNAYIKYEDLISVISFVIGAIAGENEFFESRPIRPKKKRKK